MLLRCALAGLILMIGAGGFARAADAERWARLADLDFQQIAPDNALPNSASPRALAEDGDGFLWIGSENGLARWDGYHFRDYKPDPKISGSLPDNDIQTLHTDEQGRLWIGTGSGGLARYERDQDRFVSYPAGRNGLSDVSVEAIADDGAGGLWVGTDGGLDHLEPKTDAIRQFRHSGKDRHSLPDDAVYAILRDRKGALWVGTARGVARQTPGATGFETVPMRAPSGEAPPIRSLAEDSRGRIWIGTLQNGAYLADAMGRAAVPVRETDSLRSGPRTETISTIAQAGPGEVWLGTRDAGIIAVDTGTLHTRRIRHDPLVPSSLPDDIVRCLYRDRAGLIWTGTMLSLTHHDVRQRAVSTMFGASSRRLGISDRYVDSVLSMPNGRIWLGLGSGGVDIIDPLGVRVSALRPNPDRPDTALPKARVVSLALSPSGNVYVGTTQGLYRSDSSARGVARVVVPQRDPSARVFSLFASPGALWIGGPDGLWRLNFGVAGVVAHVGHVGADRLTDQRVSTIERGPGGLWIGTENGLNRLDFRAHTIERILPNFRDATALADGYITCLLTDRRGRLWVGTAAGIDVLESRDARGRPRFRQLGLAQGLPNDDISKLFDDRKGNIWASTDEGLVVVDSKTFAVRALRRAEGLGITYYWINSGATTPAGELLFGGLGGLTAIDPSRLKGWNYHPPVVVTDARVGGLPMPVSRFNGGRSTEPIIVTPEANSLRVEFSALDYSAPERNLYAYRLRGFDTSWIDADVSNRLAAYTNLPPGDYSLELRGSNRDGAWTQTMLAVPIRVLPAWYQTIWFRLVLVLAGLGAVAALVQGRTAYLRRHERELERQVAARTAELSQCTVELRDSQLQLEQFAFFDALTGLPNRRMFTEDFRKLLARARREGGRFGLLLIDLDGFKQINDTLGHDAGDALLIETGVRLRAIAREADCVARLGGDEFVILLAEGHTEAGIDSICRRIVDSFTVAITYNGAHIATSCSIGVAECPNDGETQDSLYKSADLALYDAKRAGRNTWRWYRPEFAI